MDCHLDIAGQQLRISVLYRPPPSKANGLKNRIFVDEWASYLDQVATSTTETLLVGDLNIHMDVKDDIDAWRFTGMLYSYGLQQHVKDPNHKKDRYWMSSLPRKLVHLSRNLQLPILSCVTTMDILRLIIMLSISRRPSPSQSLHGTESSIENFKRSMLRSLSRTFHYSCIYMKGPSMSLSWHTTSHLPGLWTYMLHSSRRPSHYAHMFLGIPMSYVKPNENDANVNESGYTLSWKYIGKYTESNVDVSTNYCLKLVRTITSTKY